MIEITENATIKIADILAEENNPKARIRVFVQVGDVVECSMVLL